MSTRVIGTAGHVDHGKSTLVTALTGINPDRLKEEKAREMTIELGFAWCKLPSGMEIGIVDVPGHRDFIGNMLAGVGGMDAVLLVIAADEGVMPQTREHLAILDMLRVETGIIVLTKIDMIIDPGWLDLMEEDIRRSVTGSGLENAPVLRVSARTGIGIPALREAIDTMLRETPPRPDNHQPRMAVDRVFSLPGFGTIVTGTLLNGSLKVGDEVEILPQGLRSRIRGLQNHKHKVEVISPGQRTAVNLGGLAVNEIGRGNVVTFPGLYPPSRRLDVSFELLKDISSQLKHRQEIKFFIGASETHGSIRLLGVEELAPGKTGFLQVELDEPVVAAKGDRFILRRPSPGETLGGGTVIEVNSRSRLKRFASGTVNDLEVKLTGTTREQILNLAAALGPVPYEELVKRSPFTPGETQAILDQLVTDGEIRQLKAAESEKQAIMVTSRYLEEVGQNFVQLLTVYHHANPLKGGIPREELRNKLKLTPRLYSAILAELGSRGSLIAGPASVRLPGFSIKLSAVQQRQADALAGMFKANPFAPPSFKESVAITGEELMRVLVDRGDYFLVSPEVLFDADTYARLKSEVAQHLEKSGTITVAEFRDMYQTSRKYALGMLEHLDSIGFTKRDGDFRRLARPA